MTLSHDPLLGSCQETVHIPILSELQRILAPFPFKPYLAFRHPQESISLLFPLHGILSTTPTFATCTLCHPVGRQSQFRHTHSVDALLSSLHPLLLVIITKHVLIIVSLFGMHLCLYILALGGACILTLCLHPKSSVRLKTLPLPLYLLSLLTTWLLTSPLPFATYYTT